MVKLPTLPLRSARAIWNPATMSSVWGLDRPVRGRELTSLIVPPSPEGVIAGAVVLVGSPAADVVLVGSAAVEVVAVGATAVGVAAPPPTSHAASTMLLATIADRIENLSFPDFIVWTSS